MCIYPCRILTFVSLYRDSQEKQKAGEDIKGLEGQVKAANSAQERHMSRPIS